MFLSKDLRKVVTRLERLIGGDVEWFTPDYISAELVMLSFYPNHVLGTIDRVLSSISAVDRLSDQGWSYLEQPLRSMLTPRREAWRMEPVSSTSLSVEDHRSIQRMLEVDFSWEEAKILLLDIPSLAVSTSQMSAAIGVCRERNARNIHYLYGVLKKDVQRASSKKDEILRERSKNQVWTPAPSYSGPGDDTIDVLDERWTSMQSDIDMLKQDHAP